MDNRTSLERAISLTDEILEVLDAGEFARVNELEAKRKVLIEQAFTESVESIDVIRAHHLQNLNQAVVEKLTLLKQSIVLQQGRLRTAAKATRAYLENDSVPI